MNRFVNLVYYSRLRLDSFEYILYYKDVLAPGRQLTTAEAYSPAPEHAGQRPLAPADANEAAAGLGLDVTRRAILPARKNGETGEIGQEESGRKTTAALIAVRSNQKLAPLRRGKGLEQASCGILSSMESSVSASDADSSGSATSDGISAFVARVLDQLSLSAWLPAAFATASAAVLLQFRSDKSANLLKAIRDLAANPIQVLVIIIPVLVIATLVTQAFSFEAIRALEGYWRARGLGSLVRTPMMRRHVRRKRSIIKRKFKESGKAVHAAMSEMIIKGVVTPPVGGALEAALSGNQTEASLLKAEELQQLLEVNWRAHCDPWRLARIDRLIIEENCYPETYRIMPTKLGNLIRATEDKLQHAGDVQSFVLRRRHMVSPRVRMQHDQFRMRLEMYCTLVFVCWFLVGMTLAVLIGHVDIIPVALLTAGFAAMGVASYLAALASGAGYCSTLRQMDQAPEAPTGS